MSFDKELFTQATERLSEKRNKAEAVAEERRRLLYSRIPKLSELEKKLSSEISRLTKEMLAGSRVSLEEIVVRGEEILSQRGELLLKAGLAEDYLSPQYSCKVCQDKGFVDGRQCACLIKLQKQLAYERLSLSSALQKSGFELFDISLYSEERDEALGVSPKEKAVANFGYCKAYAERFGSSDRGIVLFGKTGLGKTHLSLSIAKKVIDRGFGVIYASVQNLLNKIESEHFSAYGEHRGETLTKLMECDLLILDDLGAEFKTSFTVAALYNLINTRQNEGRPTIISTNLSPKELNEEYGERIMSRLQGNSDFLYFIGSDVRIKLKNQKKS